MTTIKVRRDVREEDGHVYVAWGVRGYGFHPTRTDGLIFLYDLREKNKLPSPLRYGPDVTHEVTGFVIEGSEKIRFDSTLWTQPELEPVMPQLLALQFKAESDDEALLRVQAMLDAAMEGEVNLVILDHWKQRFPDAIHLSEPILDFDDPLTSSRVVDDEREQTMARIKANATERRRRRARASFLRGLGYGTAASLAVVMIAGSIMPAMDLFESMGLSPAFLPLAQVRTLEFDDGTKIKVKMSRIAGAVDRFRASVISAERGSSTVRLQPAYAEGVQ